MRDHHDNSNEIGADSKPDPIKRQPGCLTLGDIFVGNEYFRSDEGTTCSTLIINNLITTFFNYRRLI
jgi:hypothetical protein